MASTARKSIPKGRPVGSKSTDPVIAAAFGHAVVSLRTTAGMSQELLAMSAAIGRSNMSAIENGRTVPNFVGVVKIATALDCNLATLVEEFEKAYKVAREADSDTAR